MSPSVPAQTQGLRASTGPGLRVGKSQKMLAGSIQVSSAKHTESPSTLFTDEQGSNDTSETEGGSPIGLERELSKAIVKKSPSASDPIEFPETSVRDMPFEILDQFNPSPFEPWSIGGGFDSYVAAPEDFAANVTSELTHTVFDDFYVSPADITARQDSRDGPSVPDSHHGADSGASEGSHTVANSSPGTPWPTHETYPAVAEQGTTMEQSSILFGPSRTWTVPARVCIPQPRVATAKRLIVHFFPDS
jgi:hypothetical protein